MCFILSSINDERIHERACLCRKYKQLLLNHVDGFVGAISHGKKLSNIWLVYIYIYIYKYIYTLYSYRADPNYVPFLASVAFFFLLFALA